MTRPTIELFYDIASAYSYLASTQIEAVAARAGVPVVFRPFLIGGVYKATGNDMPAKVPAKAMYMVQDTARWAERYGVPMRLPSRFPLNTLRTQRALTVAAERHPDRLVPVTHALFRAYWAEDRDVSSDEEISRCADVAGLDPKAILAGIDDPAIKNELRATTDEAVARGAFGAPAIFVGDEHYFGNDRLEILEWRLARRA